MVSYFYTSIESRCTFGNMLFVILFCLAIILLMIRLCMWFIGLGYIAAVFVDVLILGGFAIYYAHHQWFVHIASGKAVYFWDILLFVLISAIYSVIVVKGTATFPRIAAIFHYAIAWVTTGFIYLFINYQFYNGFGPLLNNEQVNTIVHLIIISILALFIFNRRMRIFQQAQ